ncbi:hypothetical protein PuT2_00880 [Pusillimonas sp. T2]|uniref:putative bifunctional diguanylate cyclase/phosphodiesterase n=1 Tax=Pusillimonas sp. T2 TaxID=1548123 RepID=UPI000B9CD1D3|nr:EAL domain-containing protein [Pusillimonas sp. T2]OXR50460.1 hypothetical protein PuT2_00880 [Pusillimonas sp. T2]
MLIIDLVKNAALLVALVVAYQVVMSRKRRDMASGKVLFGVLLGLTGIGVMMAPVDYGNGIIFDSRTILLFVGGVFGGPLVAIISALFMAAYRAWLGGAGMWVGLLTILTAASIGCFYYYVRLRSGGVLSFARAWFGGVVVHGCMLMLFLLLPAGVGFIIVSEVWFTVFLAYPLATALVCLLFQDYEEKEQSRLNLHRLAYFDGLTALPNRLFLYERIQDKLAQCIGTSQVGVLVLIHVDRFSRFNDARGHAFGDKLLVQVAERLAAVLDGRGTLARMSGSEFLVLPHEVYDTRSLADNGGNALVEQIQGALTPDFNIDAIKVSVVASIGMAHFPLSDSDTAGEVLRRADTAMHRAKAAGGNQVTVYEASMSTVAERRFHLERELRQAIPEGQLMVYLQPQVDTHGTLVGAEALVRWQHPELGLVSPVSFIPLAEESDLIADLGICVLRQVCAHIAAGRFPDSPDFRVSVNISPRHFHQRSFVASITAILAETGADPHKLTFEVTESLLIRDVDDVISKMRQLSALGLHFSLDDFGTGYASLTYVKHLPIHELKIDKTFVHDAPVDHDSAALVESILAVARHMHLNVVAEGVETSEQAEFLKARGDVIYQGYLFGRPEPADAWFERFSNKN